MSQPVPSILYVENGVMLAAPACGAATPNSPTGACCKHEGHSGDHGVEPPTKPPYPPGSPQSIPITDAATAKDKAGELARLASGVKPSP
jgi:hypothetical protein